MKRVAILILGAWAAVPSLRLVAAAEPSPAARANAAAIFKKILERRPITRIEVESLAGTVFVLEENRGPAAPEGGSRGGGRVTVFRVEKGNGLPAAWSRGQDLFFKSQRMVLAALSAIAAKQEELMSLVGRQENLNRELLMGIRALGHGLNAVRTDLPGLNRLPSGNGGI
jgi:hypothetical protein